MTPRPFLRYAAALLMLLSCAAAAQEPGGREILDRVERLLWGNTVQGDYEMTISTPRWQRTLGLKVWIERPKRSFVTTIVLKNAVYDQPIDAEVFSQRNLQKP